VTVIAVTKAVDFESVKNLLSTGLTDLGESRAQQLAQRSGEMTDYLQRRRSPLTAPLQWHMIGHLQRNKVRQVVKSGAMIHSVDSLRLAEEISNRAQSEQAQVQVLLQVNCSQESQKHGCAVGAAVHLAEMITTLKNLRLCGMMTMAPLTDDPEAARHSFVRLRELFEECRSAKIGGDEFRHLSMGMSQDYELAVEEGATLLRIGTALFE
jgi:pyridoxal phosphate enzyme (YggS family)